AYQTVANAYIHGVRALFAPAAAAEGIRGTLEIATAPNLAGQAEDLAAVSAELTRAAESRLADEDPQVRQQAANQLLAKALTDLEISFRLLEAAQEAEEGGVIRTTALEAERGLGRPIPREQHLHIILGQPVPAIRESERDLGLPSDVPAARVQLSESVVDTLDLISSRASRTGQAALGGLLGMGLAEVAQAASVVGMDIAQALGQAEKVSRLYNLFRDYAVQAYETLVALLGRELAQTVAQKVLEWLEEVKEGEQFGKLLEQLYQTEQTGQQVTQLVANSGAELAALLAAIEKVEGLDQAFKQKIDLSQKLIKVLKFLALVPAAALPQGRLLAAAAYLVLGGYVVLAGADYVDTQRLERLNRVPGVRRVVEAHLAG
ncbi:MAG: hypothetical protein PVI59_17040, partial [Anaerolineae bacterium]